MEVLSIKTRNMKFAAGMDLKKVGGLGWGGWG